MLCMSHTKKEKIVAIVLLAAPNIESVFLRQFLVVEKSADISGQYLDEWYEFFFLVGFPLSNNSFNIRCFVEPNTHKLQSQGTTIVLGLLVWVYGVNMYVYSPRRKIRAQNTCIILRSNSQMCSLKTASLRAGSQLVTASLLLLFTELLQCKQFYCTQWRVTLSGAGK
jgi:hypothetical protein